MRFDQINAGLMTISDFLQSLLTPILPLFYIWAPAPEELSSRPCLADFSFCL